MQSTTEMTFDLQTGVTSSQKPTEDPDLIARLEAVYFILSNYVWILPVTLGIPGNIISIFVANRKHNRSLSPCIYMTAMAVADCMMLLQQSWFFPFPATLWGIGAYIKRRDILFK
jgi:hypothetical protein